MYAATHLSPSLLLSFCARLHVHEVWFPLLCCYRLLYPLQKGRKFAVLTELLQPRFQFYRDFLNQFEASVLILKLPVTSCELPACYVTTTLS